METPVLKFWFYDPNTADLSFFATEQERDDWAASSLVMYRKDADDNEDWKEGVSQIVCGVVTHRAQIINKKSIPRPPAEEIDEDGYDDEGNSSSDQQDEIITFDVAMLPVDRTEDPTP